jgi:hypothetical protein
LFCLLSQTMIGGQMFLNKKTRLILEPGYSHRRRSPLTAVFSLSCRSLSHFYIPPQPAKCSFIS